jgi:hypothetical protein
MKMHYLYVITSLKDRRPTAPVKIGISNNPASRLSSLQTANAEDLILFCCFAFPRDWAVGMEQDVHEILKKDHIRGEWFSTDPIQAVATICAWLQEITDECTDEERGIIYNRTGMIQNLEKLVAYKKWLEERAQ